MSTPNETVVMSPAAFTALQTEIEALETTGRREIADRIKTAREWGDLKENAEYHDAKNDQAHLETRIARLREKLVAAEVRDVQVGADRVDFGSQVVVRDEANGREAAYTLVSVTEANPSAGLIPVNAPVARALMGARPGETVTVTAPRGDRRLTVVSLA
jgi:transcription elongation factor GreA